MYKSIAPYVKVKTTVVAVVLALTTLIASSTVATIAHGLPRKSVPMTELRNYGAITNGQLAKGEWWRLLTGQFVHVKPAHMVFNVVALVVIGIEVEQAMGPLSFLFLWMLSGIAGVFVSIYHVAPPYDVGSGGSQALMGVVAGAIVLMWRRGMALWLRGVVVLIPLIQLTLDVASAHRPQPGHVVGFTVGIVVALTAVRRPLAHTAKA
jgi:membrane associated rhomboid family serine protease